MLFQYLPNAMYMHNNEHYRLPGRNDRILKSIRNFIPIPRRAL